MSWWWRKKMERCGSAKPQMDTTQNSSADLSFGPQPTPWIWFDWCWRSTCHCSSACWTWSKVYYFNPNASFIPCIRTWISKISWKTWSVVMNIFSLRCWDRYIFLDVALGMMRKIMATWKKRIPNAWEATGGSNSWTCTLYSSDLCRPLDWEGVIVIHEQMMPS